jgi:hypothetical protein
MEYTGKMEQIEDTDGQLSFVLGGKMFFAGDFTPQFRELKEQNITLVVSFNPELAEAERDAVISNNTAAPNGANAPIPPGQTPEEFANNADHCFIESFQNTAPGRYVIELGS